MPNRLIAMLPGIGGFGTGLAMRYSTRNLLAYVAFAGVMLGLVRLPFLLGCAALLAGVAVANFFVPTRLWRFVVYGIMAGVVAATVALSWYLEFGIREPHSYMDGRLEVVYFARPFVVQVGAIVGGSMGLAAHKAEAE
jgi:hypothetical protein